MLKLATYLVLSIALLGCANMSTPVPFAIAKPVPQERLLAFQKPSSDSNATLVMIRDSGFFGGGCYHAIWIDGVLAAKLDPEETATFYVTPGEHLLRVGNVGAGLCVRFANNWVQRETTVRPNQRKFFRVLWSPQDGKADIFPIESAQ